MIEDILVKNGALAVTSNEKSKGGRHKGKKGQPVNGGVAGGGGGAVEKKTAKRYVLTVLKDGQYQ